MKPVIAAWSVVLCVGCGGSQSSTAAAAPASAPASEATPQHDFELLCRLAQNAELSTLEPQDRAARLAYDIDTQITNAQVRRVFEVVAGADPPQRYVILQRGALELGVPGWECPALDPESNATH